MRSNTDARSARDHTGTGALRSAPQLALIWSLYCVAGVLISYFHEPWRDEYQALMLARSSENLLDVIHRARYEGHPSGWFMILYLIPATWPQLACAKAIAVTIMMASGWSLVFRSPFEPAEKVALLGGYFFLYEYTAFFRNYGLAVLLVFLTIALLQGTAERRWWAFLPLALLPFTQIYGSMLSMALCLAILTQHRQGRTVLPQRWPYAPLVPYFLALAAGLYDTVPAADGYFYGSWALQGDRVLHALSIPEGAFLPLLSIHPYNWDHLLLADVLREHAPLFAPWMLAAITIGIVILATRSLGDHRAAKILFLASTTLIVIFSALRFHGSLRHHGMILISYVAAMWMARRSTMEGVEPPARAEGAIRFFFPFVLCVQVTGALLSVTLDVLLPFSSSQEVAAFIRSRGWEQREVFSACEDVGVSVAGASGRPVYFPALGRTAAYMDWSSERRWGIPTEEHLQRFDSLEQRSPGTIFLTTEPLSSERMQEHHLLLFHRCAPTLRNDESFLLYATGR